MSTQRHSDDSERRSRHLKTPKFNWVWKIPGVDPKFRPADPIHRLAVEELLAAMFAHHDPGRDTDPEEEDKSFRLHGCECVDENGAIAVDEEGNLARMPCEHVLEVTEDKAIKHLYEVEDDFDEPGQDVLDTAAAILRAKDKDPKSMTSYSLSSQPFDATDAPAGSKEKKKVIRKRLKEHQSVAHPDDSMKLADGKGAAHE